MQQANSVALSPSAWWESWPAQLIALTALLTGFLSYPMIALVRRARRRALAGARPAQLLAATGCVAVAGFVAYFVTVADSANWKGISPGPTVGGRPVFWLALQALALVTVITTAMTIHAWRTSTTDRRRQGFLLAAGVLFLPWALYWGLLLP